MKMKITNEKATGMNNALIYLDGTYDKVIQDGKTQRIVQAHLDLTKGVRIANGMRLHALEPIIKLFRKEEQALLFKYGEEIDGEFKVPPSKYKDWRKEADELAEVEVEVDIEPLTDDDLQLDKNLNVGGQILSLLAPIRSSVIDQRPDKPETPE